MALLFATDVGDAAWQRMARDGVVTVLRAGVGVAPTEAHTPALRAAALAAAVPRRAALSGACALWVHGRSADAAAPLRIDIAVPRGSHPDPPPGFCDRWWTYTTDGATCATAVVIGGVLVADVGSALRSLLSRGDIGEALAASRWALAEGRIDREAGVRAIVAGRHGAPRARALAAWNAACEAAGAL